MRDQAVDLHYVERGEGNPVVLVHGFPFDHTLWDRVADTLQPHGRMILPDLRGFGKTPAPDGIFSMRLMAEDLAALLDRLQIPKVVLVGHSMGGYVSLAFAHAYPDRLAGLALVSSMAETDVPERRQARIRLAERVQRRGVKSVVEANLNRYSPEESVRERARELMLKSQKKSVIAALKGMAERPDATDWLPRVKVPCVVVAGTDDVIVTLEKSKEMVQRFSRGWLVEVPGGGHLPMLEAPDLVSKALSDLIQCACY